MADDSESVRILEGGRIVIPARLRKALGLEPGDTVRVEMEGGYLRLETRRAGIQRARELLKPYLGAPSLADELIAERRAEAEAEENG